MSDLLKVAVPALLTLFGVLAGLVIGYYKWKVERREERSGDYLLKRRESYQIFFDKLETAHLKLRSSNIDQKDFVLLLIDVNSHLLRNAIYMDQEDRELADEYLNNLFRLKEAIQKENNEKKKEDWASTTIGIPTNFLEAEVNSLRDKIIQKVRYVLKA
jgi:hypothetical protein